MFANNINSSINLFADNDSFIVVLTGSFSLFKTNFTSFLLNEIDPFSCLSFLSFFAMLFITYIPSSTFLFISFILPSREIVEGINPFLLSIIYCASL